MAKELATIPEDQRKKIYADFCGAHDSEFLSPRLAEDIGMGSSMNPLFGLSAEFGQTLERNAARADSAACARMATRYEIAKEQVKAIAEEGKRRNWPRRAYL